MTRTKSSARRLACLITAASFLLVSIAQAQRAWNWRVYKMADGLPESGCISVTVAPQGKVLARHFTLPFISELDGYSVTNVPSPEVGKSRVYASPGRQLWTAVPEGLEEFVGHSWSLHRVPEIVAEPHAGTARVIDPVPLCPIRQGLVLFLLPDRLVEFNAETPGQPRTTVLRLANQTQLEQFTGLAAARDGSLWIAGRRGLAKTLAPVRNLKPDTPWREYIPPEAFQIQNLQAPHEDPQGGLAVLAESVTNQQKVIAYLDSQQRWTTTVPGIEKLRQVWRGPEDTWFGLTTLALFQGEAGEATLRETEEIAPRQLFDVALEPDGAFWLATSDGLFRYAPLIWRTPKPMHKINASVSCLAADLEGRLWLAYGNRLQTLQDDLLQAYPFPGLTNRALQARALFVLKNGTLVLEAEDTESSAGGQLFRFQPLRAQFTPLPTGEPNWRLKPLGLLKDGTLCVQRLDSGAPAGSCDLEKYDGRRFEPLPAPPRLGASLATLFTAQNGDWWVGGENGVACYHDNKWRSFTSTDQTTPSAVLAFTELADGKIWCATSDQVWEYDGRNWAILRRGFDHINALLRTRDGVWVASNSGLHRFFQGAWIENGLEEGLAGSAVRSLCEDGSGRLWAGTSRGVSLYHPDADPDPPQTLIVSSVENGRELPEGGTLSLSFQGQDKWKYTPRERLLYSYRLNERDWSPFAPVSQVPLSDLPAGEHHFQVRAMDRNGNIEGPKPAQYDFAIVLPWYKERRLVLIAFVGLTFALFFAGLAFNRHLQLLRSYAAIEQKVAERTRQLEVANHELLHSQKMTALGTLAAGIAHDFNNILSIIKGSVQIIEDNLDNPEKIRVRADRIGTVVEQGAGIVKAMLGFSRDSGQQPSPCELNAVVQDTLKLLGDRFLREIQVRFKPATALPGIVASKDFIQQILLNFIFNAAESMDKNKQILLATHRVDELPADLVLAPGPAAAYVAVAVQDFGCGISEQTLPRIFEPFFTTKALSARRGTGLGLSMAYELAKRMAAGITVQSIVGQGSTFTLILPVAEQPQKAAYQP